MQFSYSALGSKFQERTGASATIPAVASNDPIGTWKEANTVVYATVPLADANRPTLEYDTKNRPRVRSSGSPKRIFTPTFTAIPQPLTIFTLMEFVTVVTNNRAYDSSNRILMGQATVSAYHIFAGTGGGGAVLSGGTPDTNVNQYTHKCNGGTSYLRKNGVQIISGNAGNASLTDVQFFTDGGASAFGNVRMYEMLVYSNISDANVLIVERYINNKWKRALQRMYGTNNLGGRGLIQSKVA